MIYLFTCYSQPDAEGATEDWPCGIRGDDEAIISRVALFKLGQS